MIVQARRQQEQGFRRDEPGLRQDGGDAPQAAAGRDQDGTLFGDRPGGGNPVLEPKPAAARGKGRGEGQEDGGEDQTAQHAASLSA